MAIAWSAAMRPCVEEILERYPLDSKGCEEAAAEILPLARAIDSNARRWRIDPKVGRYVAPKAKLAQPWYFHFTVETQAHFVDALTGADGVAADTYRDLWHHPEALSWSVRR